MGLDQQKLVQRSHAVQEKIAKVSANAIPAFEVSGLMKFQKRTEDQLNIGKGQRHPREQHRRHQDNEISQIIVNRADIICAVFSIPPIQTPLWRVHTSKS